MFGDRYFGARYFGNRYFGPGGNAIPVIIDDGHDGKPSAEIWEEHRQKAQQLRDTIAKAKRKANGEIDPAPEQEPPEPRVEAPPVTRPDYAALVASLIGNATRQAPAASDEDDDLMAILLLAA